MRGLINFIVFAGVVGGLGWLGWTQVLPKLTAKEEPEVPTHLVASESFRREVIADGNLKAVEATPITAPREAERPLKLAWLAADGARVVEGEVVARFDPTDLEFELEDGRDDRKTALAKIGKERVMSKSAARGRNQAAKSAKLQLDQTREFLQRDEEIFSRHQILESAIDEDLATARMAHAGEARKIDKSVSGSKIAVLAVEERKANLKISKAERALGALEVRAPHDGIFVLVRNWRGEEPRAGDTVYRGQKLAELPLVDEMEAEVFVLEADASGLEEGKSVTVIIEAHPGTTYQAKVKRVDTLAKRRRWQVPTQYFGTTLEFEETDKDTMKPGQRVRATLLLEDKKALVIPRQAVFEVKSETVVYRQNEAGGFEPVTVELGSSSPGRVVITSGLEAGDRVALRDPTRPADAVLGRDDSADEASAPKMGAP